MKKIYSSFIKKIAMCVVASVIAGSITAVNAQTIHEGFDDITTLTASGWNMQNLSSPIGITNWFQGNDLVFSAYTGATTSYIGANFNNCAGTGTISNWLITPTRTLNNGDQISFFTSKVDPDLYPDRLQVRMSTNGSSTNVGATATSVGDFTTVLLDINPTLIIGGYPITWTQYTITISGLSGPTSGRIAFRYYVTNGGPSGANSDYIGIDEFFYSPYCGLTMPAGAIAENEVCNTDANGGCNSAIPVYMNINCGTTVAATAWWDGTTRDTDWFKFSVASATTVTITVSAEFPFQVFLINNVCPVTNSDLIGPGATGNACDVVNYSQFLAAGTYVAFVAPLFDTPVFSCSNNPRRNYYLTLNMTALSTPTITPSGPTSFCAGGNVTLTSSAASSYSWSPSASTTQAIIATTTGSYTVTTPDINGCPSTSTPVAVTVNAAPTVSIAGNATTCANDTLTANATAGSGSITGYQWQESSVDISGETNSTYVATTTGTYTVIVTNSNGCSTTSAPFVVTASTGPSVNITGNASQCTADTLTANSTGAISYQWQLNSVDIPSATGSTYVATASGDYTVTVTGSGGCTSTSSIFTITVNAAPTVSITGINYACSGNSQTLSANATAGSGSITGYQWQQGNVDIAGETNSTYSASAAGSYTVIVWNSNGCSTTSTAFNFTLANNPNVNVTGTASICDGNPTLLTANATAGSGSIIGYQWQESNIDIGGATDSTYSASTSGNYTVVVTNSYGCTAVSNPFSVTANAGPSVTITGSSSICSGGSLLLTADALAGSGTITGYQWQESSVDIAGETNSTYTASTAGSYTVVVYNSNGCSATSTAFVVTVANLPTVTIDGLSPICEGDVLTANATAGSGTISGYQWQESSVDITGATDSTYAPTASGSYTVIVTNSFGCTEVSTPFAVTVNPLPVAGNTFSTTGDAVSFSNTSTDATTYSWDFGDGSPVDNSTNPNHLYSSDGTYVVTLIACNNCGCDTLIDTVTVTTVFVESIKNSGSLSVYPNPVNEILYVDFNSSSAQSSLVSIVNSLGQVIYSETVKNISGNVHSAVDVSNYASGCYTLQITGNASVIRRKFIKE